MLLHVDVKNGDVTMICSDTMAKVQRLVDYGNSIYHRNVRTF